MTDATIYQEALEEGCEYFADCPYCHTANNFGEVNPEGTEAECMICDKKFDCIG